MNQQPEGVSYAKFPVVRTRGAATAAFLAAALLFAVGGRAQEIDSQVHIVPALRVQAKAVAPEGQAGGGRSVLPSFNPQNPNPQDPVAQNQSQPSPQIVIPPGTRISMVLAQPISLSHARSGDIVNLQTSFPVAVENQMAIPPGTYVKGVIERVTHRDKDRGVMAMQLRSVDIVFANGYSVSIPAPVNIDPVLARYNEPDSPHGQPSPVLAGNGKVAPQIAMGATGTTLPPLPPLPDSGMRTAIIATGIVAAGAMVVTGILLHNHHGYDVLMEAGTPMEIILSAPLVLDTSQMAEAIHSYGGRVSEMQAP